MQREPSGLTSDQFLDENAELRARLEVAEQVAEQAEAALRLAEVRLTLATESAQVGIWEWNLQTNELMWDDAMFALYGARREDFSSAHHARATRLHPQDKAAADAASQAAIAGNQDYASEFRVIWPDGTVHYIKGLARVILDQARNPLRMIGANWDITDAKRRERNLAFLAGLQRAFALATAADIMRMACERIAQHLDLAHCALMEINEAADETTVLCDQHAAGTPTLEGRYRLADFLTEVEWRRLAAGETLLVNDVRDDGRAPARVAQFAALGIHALVNASYLADGRWKFVLHASRGAPYAWPAEDVALLTELAARLYVRIERARAEEALRESQNFLQRITEVMPGVLYVFDAVEQRNIFLNRTATSLLGYSPAEAEAMGTDVVPALMHPDDLPRFEAHLRRICALGDGESADFEHRMRDRSGAWHWFHSRDSVFARDEAGAVRQIIGTAMEIIERKQAEAVRSQLAAIVEQSNDAIFSRTLDGTILSWNAGAEKMLGYTAAEAIGKPVAFTLPPDRPPNLAENNERVLRGVEVTRESNRLTKDGRVISVLTSYSPIRDGTGNLTGVSVILQDITALKQAETALHGSQERLALAVSGARMGMFEWNVASGERLCTEQYARLLGLPTTTTTTTTTLSRPYQYHQWAQCVHPEDLPRVEAELRRCQAERVPYAAEYRVVWHDGSLHWIAARGVFLYDALGQPQRMLGIAMDVTERKQAEEAVEHARASLQSVLDTAPAGVVCADAEGNFTLANHALQEILGSPLNGNVNGPRAGYRLCHLDGPAFKPEDLPLVRALQAGATSRDVEILVKRDDGSEVVALIAAAPVRDAGGNIVGATAVLQDITARKAAEAQILQLNAELEARVAARTAELTDANRQLTERGDQLRRLALDLSHSEVRQRRHFAQVLHDQVQQFLYGARLHAGLIADQTRSAKARASAARATRLIEDATEACRLLIVELSPPLLHDAGLVDALRWLGDWMVQNHGLTVQVTASTHIAPDAEGISLLLFQCARELLFNVVKHSGIKSARVTVERADGDAPRVIIADDGHGFDVANAGGTGFGLFGIRKRLELVGGCMSIDSKPGSGARVTLQAPVRSS